MNLLIQAGIFNNLYNSCFSNNLSNMSDFLTIVVIISLMALDLTWESALLVDRAIFESQVGSYHQR